MKGISNSNSDYNFSPHRDNCGEEDKYKLVCQWFTTPYSIAYFNLRVKIKQDKGKVLVVLEAKNGKFYTIKQEFDTTHGCGGGD